MSEPILHVILGVKPFSANDMHYAGRRVDSAKYRVFKGTINDLVGGDYGVTKDVLLKLTLISGFSNKAADLDNTFKPLLDAMQLAMGFDDKQIYAIDAVKDVNKRGSEYLMIKLEEISKHTVKRKIDRLLKEFK